MLQALFIHRDLVFHGGVPRVILNLARNCDPSRVKVHVASLRAPSLEMVEAFSDLGIVPNCVGDGAYVSPALRLRKLIRENTIDVVIANSFKSYCVAKIAAAGLDIPIIFWTHSITGIMHGWMRRQMFRFLVKRDAMVSVSQSALAAHRPHDHQGRSDVVYNGVEDPMLHAEHMPYDKSMRAELGIPDDATLLCYTAEFTAWKDHATLLDAFDQLDTAKLNPHLLLIGAGELLDTMRTRAKKMRLGNRVHFLSARFDARRLLGVIDLYVHTSQGEAFGLAVVEAMLACKPVIVTSDAVFREYIEHDVSGVLFPAGNSAALAAEIQRVAGDRQLASRLGINARQRCVEKFAPARFSEAMCNVIEDAYHRIGPERSDEMLEDLLGAG